MKRLHIPQFLFCILVCLGVGGIGSFFALSSIPTWYASLSKPVFTPPNWIVGPMWITVYLLMGIALYIILDHKKKDTNVAVVLFVCQLFLNIWWSIVFFGSQSTNGGLIVIFALWGLILMTLVQFWNISKGAGVLLVPYLFWVSFVNLLNFFIYKLN